MHNNYDRCSFNYTTTFVVQITVPFVMQLLMLYNIHGVWSAAPSGVKGIFEPIVTIFEQFHMAKNNRYI